MSTKQPAEEPKTPQPKAPTTPTDVKKESQAQGPSDTKIDQTPQTVVLAEYIEKEIPNDKKIENDHQTVLVVANYLDKNPEIAQNYDYLVDWKNTSDTKNENFIAKFRLKEQFRKDVSPGGRYNSTAYTTGVKPYNRVQSNYQQTSTQQSYGGYYYEKENLGPVGEKYYSEPVEYEYVIGEHRQAGPPPTQYVYEQVSVERSHSPYVKKQVAARKTAMMQSKTQVDIKTTQTYSMYEKHREQREQRENSEYQKIQNEHIKCCEIARLSQGIRERIIQTYRAEIESHKYLESDYSGLRAIVEDLRRRKEAMDISINDLQGDYESQVHNQEILISSLSQELEHLKAQNQSKSEEASEIQEQTMTIRQEISTRDQSIIEFTSEVRTITTANQQLEREEQNLRQCISEQHELRQKHQQTIYETSGALSKVEYECNAQGSRVSVLESERQSLIERTSQLNDSLNTRIQQIEETNSKIYQAQTDISKLKSMIHGLDIEINQYEQSNAALVDEQKMKLQQNSDEYNRAHELTSQLQSLEAEYYALEVDERGFNTDLEAVNYSNQALMDRNIDLKNEYEALQKHSALLTQQNKDLQKELDSFVETDDIVRRNLDRKEKFNQIKTSVNTAINQSQTMVQQARTPTKSQYSEQQFVQERVSTFNAPPSQQRFQQDRVSTVQGTAGAGRTSYSGNNERVVTNTFTRGGNTGMEARTFDARPTGGVIQQHERQFSERSGYNPGYQAGARFSRPTSYEYAPQQQFRTIQDVRGGQQEFRSSGGQQEYRAVGGQQEYRASGGQQEFRASGGQQEFRASAGQSIGGYKYKTGGSPLRKDSPNREVSRDKQVYQSIGATTKQDQKVEEKKVEVNQQNQPKTVEKTEDKKQQSAETAPTTTKK